MILAAVAPVAIEVTNGGKVTVVEGLSHFQTPEIIKLVGAVGDIYIYGAAGGGKTTIAKQVAAALGRKFFLQGKVEDEFQLKGFVDAQGRTMRTPFREAFEFGGVFLWDELDASNSNAITALNAALDNGLCDFPDQQVERHPEFICIGAGNTAMSGADSIYVGRSAQDGAVRERFAFFELKYDERLERSLACNDSWASKVVALRSAVAELKVKLIISPRASIKGAKMLAAGFTTEQALSSVVFKGLASDQVAKIRQKAGV